MPHLTRPQMEAVIASGGSVVLGGIVYRRAVDLPSTIQLAGDDLVQLATSAAELDRQIAALTQQRKSLETTQAKAVQTKATRAAKDAAEKTNESAP
jgi:uncharacterized small protein (DUF1192 family)